MSFFWRPVLLFVLGMGVLVSGVWIGCDRSEAPLARVGSKKITLDDLNRAWAELPPRYKHLGKRWLLETLINRQIAMQEARALGLQHSERVRSELAKATVKKLRDELFQRAVVNHVEVSEADIQDYFKESGMDSRAEVRVAHIVVESEEEAERILQELDAGGDFAELARQYSLEQETAPRGGDVGYLREGAAAGPGVEKAFSMEVGEVSEPIRGSQGYYHLIKVLDRRPAGLEQQRAVIENRVRAGKTEMARQAYMGYLREKFDLKVNKETLAFLVHQGKMAVDRLPSLSPSGVERILLTYRGGTISVGTYVSWLDDTGSVRRRPSPVDSAQIVWFAQNKAITEVLYPLMARKQGLHREETVRSYLEQKQGDLLIEELKRVAVESKVLPEDTLRAYYERYLERFVEPQRVFVEAVLTEDVGEARSVLERCRHGEDMERVARTYPLRSTGKSSYRVFSFSRETIKSPSVGEWIQAVQDAPVGAYRGPVALGSDSTQVSPPRYAVLHILARRGSRIRDFEEPGVRAHILKTLRKAKQEEIEQAFNHFLEELRRRNRHRINIYTHDV